MAIQRHARLGTQLRGHLSEEYNLRGHAKSNIWYIYSPKARADFVLPTDIRFGHFLMVESDVDIVKVDYSPSQRLMSLIGQIGKEIHAEVVCKDGVSTWRTIVENEISDDALNFGNNIRSIINNPIFEYRVDRHEFISEKQIYVNEQRICNWLRVIPWMAQARDWPLEQYGNLVLIALRSKRVVQLAEVQALGTDSEIPLYTAALFTQVQRGRVGSNMDEEPLTPRSQFFLLD